MYIEIRKAGFVNKGAQLMLHSIVQEIHRRFPEVQFVMAPNLKLAPYEERAKMGFYQKAWYWRYRRQWGNIARYLPQKYRKMYGIVLDKQIDVVLDAAGFSYGDQHNISNLYELADSCKRWKRNNTKVIFLPQAFGPFNSSKSQKLMKIVTGNSDAIFVRDEVSWDHIVHLAGEQSQLKRGHDFTNLLNGVIPEHLPDIDQSYAIVPNWRMAENGKKNDYINLLKEAVNYILTKGSKAFILVHEGVEDMKIANELNSILEQQIEVIHEDDPLKIKGMLGACKGTFGSRFHGLVSALSQGTPSLATSWSHKYKMLMQDYDFSEGLIDLDIDKEELHKKLDLILEANSAAAIQKKLLERSDALKTGTEKMWDEIADIIQPK
ncbi:MAG: polysaccharide pyruvyl transferase family protein [Bacteroidales bacterium]